MARSSALLASLLLHANEVVSRDRLIDELWGAAPPDTAPAALQVHVSQLRKALGRDLILTQTWRGGGGGWRRRGALLHLNHVTKLVAEREHSRLPECAGMSLDSRRPRAALDDRLVQLNDSARLCI